MIIKYVLDFFQLPIRHSIHILCYEVKDLQDGFVCFNTSSKNKAAVYPLFRSRLQYWHSQNTECIPYPASKRILDIEELSREGKEGHA